VCWRRSGRQKLERTTWRCSLQRHGWSETQGERFAAWAQERLLLYVRPDGLRLWLERPAMAQKVVFFVADLGFVSHEGPYRGGEILGYLGVDRSPKTVLVDVEPKRCEDLIRRKDKLGLLQIHKVKMINRINLIDCGWIQSVVTLHLYKRGLNPLHVGFRVNPAEITNKYYKKFKTLTNSAHRRTVYTSMTDSSDRGSGIQPFLC
jgi:hypothetical protein